VANSRQKALTFFEPGGEPEGIEGDALARARSAVEKLKRAYLNEWAPASVDELERVLRLAGSSPDLAGEHLNAAFRISHDMKGQGATFGFDLLTEIGSTLCTLTYNRDSATPAEFQAMLTHVEAARAVIALRIEDADSAEAAAIREKVEASVRTHFH